MEFNPESSSSWVGNFQRGLTDYDAVFLHPSGNGIIVIAGGQGYVVDSKARRLITLLGGQLQYALFLPNLKTIVISNGLWLECHGDGGRLWRTRRISWDGIWDLREHAGRLFGKCWDAVNDTHASFSIDIRTGDVEGGVHPEPPDLKP